MNTLHKLLTEYSASHQNPQNRAIHWVCVPLILFASIGLLRAIPLGNGILNVATISVALALVYYFSLSVRLAAGMTLIMVFLYMGTQTLYSTSNWFYYVTTMAVIFVLAWIGQAVGHLLEGSRPSFVKDLQFLLIGPLWLLAKAYRLENVRPGDIIP